jgi:hypothetical protein
MTEVILHATPRWRDVVLEQFRIVGLRLRREALVVAVVLGIVTAVIVIDIARGTATSWFDSDEWAGIGFASFLFPFAVWRGQKRFGPAFLWTLPVDRRRLALARVFSGWMWLMAAALLFVSWQRVLAFFSGVTGAQVVPLVAFIGATATYLLGSALVLGLRHPLRWLLGAVAVLFLLGFFNERVDNVLDPSTRFTSALHATAEFWPFLALGAGLAALWAAISRHRENR